jgi:hypothetical protein
MKCNAILSFDGKEYLCERDQHGYQIKHHVKKKTYFDIDSETEHLYVIQEITWRVETK